MPTSDAPGPSAEDRKGFGFFLTTAAVIVVRTRREKPGTSQMPCG